MPRFSAKISGFIFYFQSSINSKASGVRLPPGCALHHSFQSLCRWAIFGRGVPKNRSTVWVIARRA